MLLKSLYNFQDTGGSKPRPLYGVDQHHVVHVSFRGGAPATIANQVSVYLVAHIERIEQVRVGMLKSLGISTAKRSYLFPGMPAISETLPDFEVVIWFGIFAPAGTPPAIVAKQQDAVVRAVATPQYKKPWRNWACSRQLRHQRRSRQPSERTLKSGAKSSRTPISLWTSTRNHKSLRRRPLTRRWWTLDFVQTNGSASLL